MQESLKKISCLLYSPYDKKVTKVSCQIDPGGLKAESKKAFFNLPTPNGLRISVSCLQYKATYIRALPAVPQTK